MKRIMAIILTVVMVASMGTFAFAADPATVKEAITTYGTNNGITGGALTSWLTRSLAVPTNIEVRENGDATWEDGPIEIEEKKVGSIPTFDFQATIDMGTVKDAFDDYIAATTLAIESVGGSNVAALKAQLNTIPVSGTFTISVKIPENMTMPDAFVEGNNMTGFNADAKKIFHEVSRSVDNNVATIVIGVGGNSTAANDKATKAELDECLGNDLTLTCTGVQPEAFDTYVMTGKFEGQTVIGDNIATISYTSEPMGGDHNPDESVAPFVSATVKVSKKSSSSSSGSGTIVSTKVAATFIVDGKVYKEISDSHSVTVDLATITPGTKEGFKFAGWFYDKELTKKAEGKVTITSDTDFYAKWVVSTEGPVLDADNHFAYIIGYTDGTVKPLNNILREEVAAIFFRLLTEEAGDAMHKDVAPYSDVPATKWSSTAIATLSNGGYITGREDGTFAPEAYITRAEFATIAARFSDDVTATGATFSDVDGHWAKNYIDVCVANGWIKGYEDGTFKPDQNITRAEAMAIVNRMLGRGVKADGIAAVKGDIFNFSDNVEGAWYYYEVLEATNSHDYIRAEGAEYEAWTSITKTRDWTSYEK